MGGPGGQSEGRTQRGGLTVGGREVLTPHEVPLGVVRQTAGPWNLL